MIGAPQGFSELFVTYLVTRGNRIEEDLIDQLFNSSERRLARLLSSTSQFRKAPARLRAAAGNGIFAAGDRRPKTCLRDETCVQRHKSGPHDREKPAENGPFLRQVFHGEFRSTGWWWWRKSAANRSQRFLTLIFLYFWRIEVLEASTNPICLDKLASYGGLDFNRRYKRAGSEQVAIRAGTRPKLVGKSNDTGRARRMRVSIRIYA
jgi:hypothetical protein